MKRTASAVLYGILATLLLASASFGQQSATGVPPFSSWSGGQFDSVNLANLNVHFQVPIVHKAGRGLPFNYDLSYDSTIWTSTPSGYNTWAWKPAANWGWTQPLFANLGTVWMNYMPSYCYDQNGYAIGDVWQESFNYTDSHGTVHYFSSELSGYDGNCTGTAVSSFTETTHDGSGLTLSVYGGADYAYATIMTPDGVTFDPPVTDGSSNSPVGTGITDNNGNQITSNGSGQFTDTTGTVALTVSGSVSTAVTYTYPGPSGSQAVTFYYLQRTIRTNFGCSGINEYGPTTNYLLDHIVLPDTTEYQFTYEPTSGYSGDFTGRLASVKLPTGGTITYSYTGSNDGINCNDGGGTGLTRALASNGHDVDGGGWSYTRTPGGGGESSTTQTSPTGDLTQIIFQNGFETQRAIYQGSSTLLETVNTCYNGNFSNCFNTVPSTPITQRTTFLQYPSGLESESVTSFNSTGQVTEVKNYDFGNGAPGSLLRDEFINYASLGNIFDRPSMVLVYGGTGGASLVSETKYQYDESSLQTSGAPQHVGISRPRGNLTTLTKYSTVSGGNPSGPLSQHFTYYDTGTPYTSTDVNGGTTTFGYGTGSCGGSFVTQTSLALGLSTSQTWDCNGGVVTSSTDMNGNPTTYSYDLMWRPTTTTYPDTGQTTIGYNLANNPPEISITKKIDGSHNLTSTIVLDGFGRTKEQALTSDPAGSVYKDFFYDSNERLYAISNPYRSSSDPTYGTTEYTFDALNRIITVTNPDNTTKLMSYSGRATEVQDEGNGTSRVTRIYQSDGLGRMTSVCEVTSATQLGSGGTPSACGQDIAATGFRTSYGYDALGNLISVTQNGLNSRSYSYDALSRLLTESNPESGTTSYTYDSCSAGDLCTRVRPRANQADPVNTTTTSYAYDALHRLTEKSYNDGTLPVYNYYDESSIYGATLQNTKGRLSRSVVYDPWHSYFLKSYDAMGRVLINWQDAPQDNGDSYNLQYSYDLLGDETSMYNSREGVDYYYAYNTAAQLTNLQSSLVNSGHPENLYTVNQYNALGEVTQSSFGNGIFRYIQYDHRGRISSQSDDPIYSYSLGLAPNGDVLEGFDSVNGSWYYAYDNFNRLSSAIESGGVRLDYSYDRFGNRWQQNVSAGSGPAPSYTFNANNQSPSFTYDAAGNITNDGVHNYTYDAEGRMVSVDGGSTATYFYDPSGRRVEESLYGGAPINFLYDLQGHMITEETPTSWIRSELYAGGSHVALYANSTTYFMHTDWLGSTKNQSDMSGNSAQWCSYLPFGDGFSCPGSQLDSMNFTGHQWDGETGFSHTEFRQYNPTQGRWMTPDPGGLGVVDPTNPQSWNRYAYVMNNPLNLIDLAGLEACYVGYLWGPGCLPGDAMGGGGGMGGGQTIFTGDNSLNWPLGSSPFDIFNQVLAGDFSALGVPTLGQLTGPIMDATPGNNSTTAANNQSFWGYLTSKPWVVSWILPVLGPVPGVVGVGPAGGVAWNPQTHNLCVGAGLGASAGHNAAIGPLLTSSGNVDSILSGWSVSGGGNLPFPSPAAGLGWQVIANSSGVAQGPTAGVAGLSGSVTWSACAKLW